MPSSFLIDRLGMPVSTDDTIANGDVENSLHVAVQSHAVKPLTLVGSIQYSQFTASASIFPTLQNVLTPNATSRTIVLKNNLDQPLSAVPSVSVINYSLGTGSNSGTAVTLSGSSMPVGFKYYYVGSNYGSLNGVGTDSIMLSLAMGATLPTKGTIDVYVSELIG